VQECVVNLQELLKSGRLVDKMFAFSPIIPDEDDKKIHKTLRVPTNITILDAPFKISSSRTNPFEKQKQ
jgi:hypothetical protein